MTGTERPRSTRTGWLWLSLVLLLSLSSLLVRDRVGGESGVPSGGGGPPAPGAVWDTPAPTLAPSASVVVDSAAVADALRAYASHVARAAAPGDEDRYAAMGIARLGIAVGALAGRESGPDPRVVSTANQFFRAANRLLATPDSVAVRAARLRPAAVAAAEAMDALAEARSLTGAAMAADLRQARQAAEDLRSGEDAASQREGMRRFFEEAGDVLVRLEARWRTPPGP